MQVDDGPNAGALVIDRTCAKQNLDLLELLHVEFLMDFLHPGFRSVDLANTVSIVLQHDLAVAIPKLNAGLKAAILDEVASSIRSPAGQAGQRKRPGENQETRG